MTKEPANAVLGSVIPNELPRAIVIENELLHPKAKLALNQSKKSLYFFYRDVNSETCPNGHKINV